ELGVFGWRYPPRPFDEGHVGEGGERRPRAEVPGLERHVDALDAQPAALGQAPILLRRQMAVGRTVVREVARPTRRLACLLDDVVERSPITPRYELQESTAPGAHGVADGAQGRGLVPHPVERVERDDEIEGLAVRQAGGVTDLEAQVRVLSTKAL